MLSSSTSKSFYSSFPLLLCPSTLSSPSLTAWYLTSLVEWEFVVAFRFHVVDKYSDVSQFYWWTQTFWLHLCWLLLQFFFCCMLRSSDYVGGMNCNSHIISTVLYNPLPIRSVWHCNLNGGSCWQPISACPAIITTTSRAVLLGNFKCRQSFNQQ